MTLEEWQATQDKTNRAHFEILAALNRELLKRGWGEVGEIPAGVDLWARRPTDRTRVIFEAKTISAESEVAQTRHAFAQLLEYRFRYGEPADMLCLVTNEPVSTWRVSFLEHHGIAVVYVENGGIRSCGVLAEPLLTNVLSSNSPPPAASQ